jgi:hypothetical protein
VVDDGDVGGSFLGVEFEAELFLKGGEDVGGGIVGRGRRGCAFTVGTAHKTGHQAALFGFEGQFDVVFGSEASLINDGFVEL